jgi:hypothetical protein
MNCTYHEIQPDDEAVVYGIKSPAGKGVFVSGFFKANSISDAAQILILCYP